MCTHRFTLNLIQSAVLILGLIQLQGLTLPAEHIALVLEATQAHQLLDAQLPACISASKANVFRWPAETAVKWQWHQAVTAWLCYSVANISSQ